MVYRHLGYQVLSSSLRNGIFARVGSHNARSFCLRESSSDLSPPHWLMSRKELPSSPNICCLVRHPSAVGVGFTLFSPFTEQYRLFFFALPWLVWCLYSEMLCCFRRGCWRTSWSSFGRGWEEEDAGTKKQGGWWEMGCGTLQMGILRPATGLGAAVLVDCMRDRDAWRVSDFSIITVTRSFKNQEWFKDQDWFRTWLED